MDNFEIAKRFFLQALEHHNNHRLREAEALYRQAYSLAPDRLSVLSNLAAVLASQRRHAEARKFCELALAIDAEHSDSLMILACCHREMADLESSLHLLERLATLKPNDLEVHSNMGIVLDDLGLSEEALRSYGRALDLNHNHVGVLVNRSKALARLGRLADAYASLKQALTIAPESVQARLGFVDLVTHHDFVAPDDVEFETCAIRAISTPWCRPQRIAPVLIRLLWSNLNFRHWIRAAENALPERLQLDNATWHRILDSRILAALLLHAPITNVPLERLLTALRYRLLREVVDGTGSSNPKQLAFHCALARQCFINEHVYHLEDGEKDEAFALKERCDAVLATNDPIPMEWLPAVATYFPLSSLVGAERLLDRQWPDAISELCEQQVGDLLVEHQYRDAMPRLTKISDHVSGQVRQQYEENPYPRWVGMALPPNQQTIDAYLRRRFPGSAYRSTAGAAHVTALNAGCGTGQHPIETALRFSGIEILAIDLSLSSLAYAARMAKRVGLNNIRFAQADILEAGSLEYRFDLIESDGVLHHMEDPARGLANLHTLLAESGVMKLALYSEQARRPIVAARKLIEANGYRANDQDIREFREDIMRLDKSCIERQVTDSADFYTLSECRDLLFHVQEHRFTIPKLKEILSGVGLEFIGFELTPRQIAGFSEAFPDKQSLYSLDDWHECETRNPRTFRGMYQFWVQRGSAKESFPIPPRRIGEK